MFLGGGAFNIWQAVQFQFGVSGDFGTGGTSGAGAPPYRMGGAPAFSPFRNILASATLSKH